MRIISGGLKGKKLLVPLDKSTRPLKDMVRESIFNILDHSTKLSAKINNVNIIKVKGKNKRSRYRIKKRPDWKKAYVRLAAGQSIEVGTE